MSQGENRPENGLLKQDDGWRWGIHGKWGRRHLVEIQVAPPTSSASCDFMNSSGAAMVLGCKKRGNPCILLKLLKQLQQKKLNLQKLMKQM
jgi:hypothetical protein